MDIPEDLGLKEKGRRQPAPEPVVGVPPAEALPKAERGWGQAVPQDSVVEVEAGSMKDRHLKEKGRRQPDPRKLEQEGG